MSEKKKFLLRLDESLYAALERWAAHDLRSVNAQIEFLLTDAARKSGRLNSQEMTNDDRDTSDSGPSAA
jgi:hypothetical protein